MQKVQAGWVLKVSVKKPPFKARLNGKIEERQETEYVEDYDHQRNRVLRCILQNVHATAEAEVPR
ncbi:MAG: hypothetical protein NWE94_06585 [Candidatus Bathyarchaeota archaeon]|nr:hypothetical protein [Candidatus Bathyarchaeota archaeon]